MGETLTGVAAAILAGGPGTRLRSVVADRPKVLAPVRGRPFVTYLLDQLGAAGAAEVVLLTGYRGGQVREALGEGYRGLRLRYSEEPVPLGTGGAVRHALALLAEERVLLLNGDSYCDVELGDFVSAHRGRDADAALVLARVADTGRFGRVAVGAGRRIERFEEKGAAGPGWVNAGVYLLRRGWVASWPEGILSLERDLLPAAVAARRARAHRCDGDFLDIGTPESFEESETFFGRRGAGFLTCHA
jgi:D-glycero-alpha-D-manno-heptose 1-phosphate guanylyltransferase